MENWRNLFQNDHEMGCAMQSPVLGHMQTVKAQISLHILPTSNFQPIKVLDPDCCYKFKYIMANSADLDQKPTDLDLHCFQRQYISGFSRTRVKYFCMVVFI